MMGTTYEKGLEILETTFGDRLRRPPAADGALASVMPLHAEEVMLVSEVAARHSLRLVPVLETRREEPLQGTVSSSGEILLLTIETQ